MKLIRFILTPLSALLLWACAYPAPGSGNAPFAAAQNGRSSELDQVLVEFASRLDSIRIAIDAGSLRLVHPQAEELLHCVKAINGLYGTDVKWRKKKFKSHQEKVRGGIHWLHEHADARDAIAAKDALAGLTRDFRSFETFLQSASEGQ